MLIHPAESATFDLAGPDVHNIDLGNGRRAAPGTSHLGGARWLDVEVVTGTWVGMLARNITDEDLLQIGSDMVLNDEGAAMIDATATGLVDRRRSPLFGTTITYTLDGSDPVQWPAAVAMTEYVSADGVS